MYWNVWSRCLGTYSNFIVTEVAVLMLVLFLLLLNGLGWHKTGLILNCGWPVCLFPFSIVILPNPFLRIWQGFAIICPSSVSSPYLRSLLWLWFYFFFSLPRTISISERHHLIPQMEYFWNARTSTKKLKTFYVS